MRDILAVPFGWILSFLYNITDSYVFAIVLLTLFIRLLLLPASISQQKNSAKQVRLNTKVNKIKQKYAGNQQKIQEETQALYQREGFGAANMGCAPLLIQMIVMIGLYEVIYRPLTCVLRFGADKMTAIKDAMGSIINSGASNANAARTLELDVLRHFSEHGDKLAGVLSETDMSALENLRENFTFLGLDLTATPDKSVFNALWIIPIVSCLTAFASSLYMFFKQKKQNPEMAKNPTMGCMTFMSPVMSLVFTFMFPAGVGVYWIISNIISFVQQIVLSNVYSPSKVIAQQMVDETVKRRSKENNIKQIAHDEEN